MPTSEMMSTPWFFCNCPKRIDEVNSAKRNNSDTRDRCFPKRIGVKATCPREKHPRILFTRSIQTDLPVKIKSGDDVYSRVSVLARGASSAKDPTNLATASSTVNCISLVPSALPRGDL